MSWQSFPRPYTTLLVSGWEIDHGEVAKVGIVRTSATDDPQGSIILDNIAITDTLFPSNVETDEDKAIAVVCIVILSRRDVRAAVGPGA